ncbi:MAG: hypothetical protein ACK5LV_01640 [Lachnospirales bacterium]
MKTAQDFENELIDTFSTYYGEAKFKEKIPKKNSYIFENKDNSQIVLKKVNYPDYQINFNNDILKSIIANDKNIVETVFPTIDSALYVVVNDFKYMAFSNISTLDIDLTNKDDVAIYFKTLYSLHNSLNNIEIPDIDTNIKNLDMDIDNYVAKLQSIKRQVSNIKKKSDFDFAFLKEYSETENLCLSIQSKLREIDEYKNRKMQVIYNYAQISKKVDNPTGVVKTPCTFTIGYYMVDLCKFITKYLRKNDIENLQNLDEILNSYNTNFSEEEIEITKLLLQFPFKRINIMQQYYDKKRVFVPTETLNALKETKLLSNKIQSII